MAVEATLKSYTNLIKRDKIAKTVSSWAPAEFHGQTPEEIDALEMFSEGVTERAEWIGTGYHIYQPSHQPSPEGEMGQTHNLEQELQDGSDQLAPADGLLQALFGGAPTAAKKNFFKKNQIAVSAVPWATLEELVPPKVIESQVIVVEKETETDVEVEPAMPDMEEIQQQIDQMLQAAHDEAQQHAAQLIQEAHDQAEMEAENIHQQAHSKASEILLKASQEESEITHQAYRRGMEVAKEEALSVLSIAQAIVNGMQEWHKSMLAQAEPEVVAVLNEAAKNMFGQGMVLPEEMLKEAFSRAVADAKSLGDLRIHANSEDVAALGDLWAQKQAALMGMKIELVSQDNIQRGGCLIEGDFGSLDARVDLKLSRILEKITEIEQMPFETEENPDLSGAGDIEWNSHLVESLEDVESASGGTLNSTSEESVVLDMDYSFGEGSSSEDDGNLFDPGQFSLGSGDEEL